MSAQTETLQDSQRRIYGDFSGILSETDERKFFIQEYIPEMITVEKDWILEDIKNIIQIGLEHTQECLFVHDQQRGRTIRRNKEWAETLENDIRAMKLALVRIGRYNNN